jgi:hypothetical protein
VLSKFIYVPPLFVLRQSKGVVGKRVASSSIANEAEEALISPKWRTGNGNEYIHGLICNWADLIDANLVSSRIPIRRNCMFQKVAKNKVTKYANL